MSVKKSASDQIIMQALRITRGGPHGRQVMSVKRERQDLLVLTVRAANDDDATLYARYYSDRLRELGG
ncbi:MAG TPA: hypothetical protein VLG36_04405 [Candidatus Chromulinivoraceae bacterium]|nr:hypothetical protein [Candidatus Chromulinivoraceae bacterium]